MSHETVVISQELKERVTELLVKFGLNFEIEKIPMFGHRTTEVEITPELQVGLFAEPLEEVEQIESPYYGLLNTDSGNIINAVSKQYTVTQTRDVMTGVLKGIEDYGSEITVMSAGVINDGRKIYVKLRIEERGYVKGDMITRFIVIVDSNDSTSGLSVGIGDETMSCTNQYVQFFKGGRCTHKSGVIAQIERMPILIKGALDTSYDLVRLYNEFVEVGITERDIHDIVEEMIGYNRLIGTEKLEELSSRKRNTMETLYTCIYGEMDGRYNVEGDYVEGKGRNLWGLHSGITYWTSHERSVPTRANGRIESIMVGSGYQKNQASLEFCKGLLDIAKLQ